MVIDVKVSVPARELPVGAGPDDLSWKKEAFEAWSNERQGTRHSISKSGTVEGPDPEADSLFFGVDGD